MTIIFQTGLPGHCKTLYTLDWVEAEHKKSGRPVFFSGINIKDAEDPTALAHWQEIDPLLWYTAPPEAIVVIDECQRIFRPRPNGAQVPKHEEELETHRHGGIDLVLLTQKPRLVSMAVRELVGDHRHAVRRFGLQRSTIHRWTELKFNVQSRKDSVREEYKFNREVFKWYKSAEAHTIKRNVPMRVYVLIAMVLIFPVLIWYIAHRVYGFATDGVVGKVDAAQSSLAGKSGGVQASDSRGGGSAGASSKLTRSEYVAQFQPRVDGLLYTAPVYDDATKVVNAPYPAACIQAEHHDEERAGEYGRSAAGCRCYTQQGTRLAMPDKLCRDIAEGGFFMAWAQPQRQEPVKQSQERPLQAVASVVGGVGSFGGQHERIGAAIPSASILDDGPPPPGRGKNLPKPGASS